MSVALCNSDSSIACRNVLDSKDSVVVSVDTIRKQPGFFKRLYEFLNKICSPKRDLRYIDVQDYYNWCAMLQFSTKMEFYQIDTDDKDLMMRIAPQTRYRVGPFFGWRAAFFGYNIDLTTIFTSKDDIDLSGSIYSAAFGFDLFYRRVGGNYSIDKLKYKSNDLTPYLHGKSFDGARLGMTRVSFYYVPNFRHYSHQAAFSQTHRQLISAGSIELGLQYSHNTCDVDWNKLIDLMSGYDASLTSDFSAKWGRQYNDEFTITVGYGYNWVFAKNWLLGSEICGGLGYLLQHESTKYEENYSSGKTTTASMIDHQFHRHLAFDGSFRFALIYNSGPIYTGLQGVAFYYQHGNGVMMSKNFICTLYAMFGVNF